MKKVEKYTFGMGDRFGRQGEAQLQAIQLAHQAGIEVYPTWNKSYREHSIVGTEPHSLRIEADDAVSRLGWSGSYYVDADHIRLETVDGFIQGSDFFTLDVAEYVDKTPSEGDLKQWLNSIEPYFGALSIAGLDEPLELSRESATLAGERYLEAIREAGKLYRYIEDAKGCEAFVTEVSIDETDSPQGPADIFYLLSMIAMESIPVQTIAPKFTGRFNKGVDFVGDLSQFEKEFHADLCIVRFAVRDFKLPEGLKISVHSGSDKYSLYPIINRLIKMHDAGLHVKTAGTTWLEEVIGLARAGGDGLRIAKKIYEGSIANYEELVAPYRTVIDIDRSRLPSVSVVNDWTSEQFVAALEHIPERAEYNPHLRQLVHVGFKVAAAMGGEYTNALDEHAEVVAAGVTRNLYDRHIKPIFS